jgi:hypothetical protein
MSSTPKIDAIFNMSGSFVIELKSVLAGARIYEGADYAEAGFDIERQTQAHHLLHFHTKDKAAEAKMTWEKHAVGRGRPGQ